MLETFKKLPKKKQKAILDAAAKVFAQKGYYRANVADICKKARISNGALYKYFKNKEDVFTSVFDRTVQLFSVEYEAFFSTEKSIYQKIQTILEKILYVADRYADYIVIYFDLGSPSMSKFAPALSGRIENPAKAFWLSLIKEGKKRGEIDEKINSKVASYIIDNHVMLFMFSCVSEHYSKRFNSYFGKKDKALTNKEKTDFVLKSIRTLLTKRT